jgi:hypothetical protein
MNLKGKYQIIVEDEILLTTGSRKKAAKFVNELLDTYSKTEIYATYCDKNYAQVAKHLLLPSQQDDARTNSHSV